MALNFPNSPVDGQIYYDTTTGAKYVWEAASSKWKSMQYTAVAIGFGYQQANVAYTTANAAFAMANAAYNVQNVDFTLSNSAFLTANLAFDSANSNWSVQNALYTVANTSYASINSNWAVTNALYSVANSAFASANNVGPQIAPTYNTANAAFGVANASFAEVNAAYTTTNTAYASINSNWTVTNALYSVANSAFASANNVGPQIAPTYNTANTAYNQANAAYNGSNAGYTTANAAFAFANTRFSSSGGTISGAVEITADLTVHGNTKFIDQQTLQVGDPLIYLAANNYTSDVVDIGFVANYVNATSANVHTGLFRSSGSKEYYLFQGYDKEPINNYIDPVGNNITMAVLNATVRTSNLILGGANTINWITSGYGVTNAAYGFANSAYASINSNWTVTNSAYGQINTNTTTLTSAYGVANAVYGQVNTNTTTLTAAYGVANAAFSKANNALANTTGSLAGNLTVAGGSISGASQTTYALSLGNFGGSSGDLAFGSDASYGYMQSFNSKPLCINNQGNNVGIGGAPSYKLHVFGTGFASSDFRAPIFYDSDNTAYYVDPASTSVLSTLNVGQQIGGGGGDQIVQWRNTRLANSTVTAGSHVGWANTPLPGVYYSDYTGNGGGIVVFPGTGSVGRWGIEATYYGDMWLHSNTDSNRWYDYRILTDYNLSTQFTQSRASSGYIKLPGGVILQWGNQSLGANSQVLYNFPIAFPSGCYGFAATGDWDGSGGWAVCGGSVANASQFYLFTVTDGGPDTIWWIAMGY